MRQIDNYGKLIIINKLIIQNTFVIQFLKSKSSNIL